MTEAARNLALFYLARAQSSIRDTAVLYRREGGWNSLTWGEWSRKSMLVAHALRKMGVGPGDSVMVAAPTSHQFLWVAWGVAYAGAVLVPTHPGLPEQEFREILASVRPAFLFLGNPALLQRLRPVLRKYEGRIGVIATECIVGEADAGNRPFLRLEDVVCDRDEAISLPRLLSLGEELGGDRLGLPEGVEEIPGDAPAMMIHTAGTLGEQKGVVLSHAALLYQARTLAFVLPVGTQDVQLLFLPLSHILGVIAFLTSVASGSAMAMGGGMRSLLEDLRDVRPTFMVGVPRVYEKVVEKMRAVVSDFSAVSWELYRRGLAAARSMVEAGEAGRKPEMAARVQLELARRTVFQRCREMFGGRVRFLVSGGAALSQDVAHAMHAFGIPLLDGFGLTETSGATHLNRVDHCRIGTVGQPLPLVQTRIGSDGEVLVRGPGLMLGYLDDREATRCAVDEAGWLHTGDLGAIDADGSLRITGRKKNIIVTAGGRNVVPAKIEHALHEIPEVSHAIVVGDGRPYLTALLTVSARRLGEWASSQNILFDNLERLRSDVRFYRDVEEKLEKVNARLAPHERVRRFAILDSDFSVESGELTHDFKVRRRVVLERYRELLELLYSERM
ncbi:MAG: AMP-binding protein [Deltaproteobacteria bacterium]|nr:AMP-binding protein [Deltaproteobacteria bacterium]